MIPSAQRTGSLERYMSMKINVCIIGAGGTMGYKTARNILKHKDKYALNVCEIDPEAIARLKSEGYNVLNAEEAVPIADIVVPAINDSNLKSVAPQLLKMMKSGASMIVLDPAAVVAGEIPVREDCTLVIAHPCHPSAFRDQDTPEARADKYGGDGGKMDIVMAKVSGSDENFELCRKLAMTMMEPVVKSFVMTPEQMAFLEPTLVEILGATCLSAMAETLEEAVRRGIDRDAVTSFLCGHLQNVAFTFIGLLGDTQVSDACKVAVDIGKRLVLRDDWKRIWDDDVLHNVILTMLHPEQAKI